MSNFSKAQIISLLDKLIFKDGQKLTHCMSEVIIKGEDIGFSINITGKDPNEGENLRQAAISLLEEIKEINKISISLTSDRILKPSMKQQDVPGVKKILLVAAGKGGVGKSTIAAVIAQQIAQEGFKVGLVDADIYGPSMPAIFGIKGKPEIVDNKFIPHIADNIKVMSIGFLVDPNAAVAWRGPMVNKILYQILMQTSWDDLDYLIIDMPPGTGDIHLSLAENYKLNGAVIVTSPWQLSVNDATKAIDLLKIYNVPIFGVIENFSLPETSFLFENSGGEQLAQKYHLPLICKIPINYDIAHACDQGTKLNSLVKIPLEFLKNI